MSCLGVSGWGPLHWWLRRDGEPEAVLAHLRRAWRLASADGATDPRATLLLAALLRSGADLRPLAVPPLSPSPAGMVLRHHQLVFRHRLVCRPGQRWLHLRSWECGSATLPWRGCGLERRLDAALLSLQPKAAVPRGSVPT